MQQRVLNLEGLSTTKYYSSQEMFSGALFENGTQLLVDKILNPDKGSDFHEKFKDMYNLPLAQQSVIANQILRSGQMNQQGYDALLLHDLEGKVYGYAVYETKKDGTPHLFSHNVVKDYREQGLGLYLAEQLAQMFIAQGVTKARFGAGNNDDMNSILRRMDRKGYKTSEEGWIDLSVNPMQKAA